MTVNNPNRKFPYVVAQNGNVVAGFVFAEDATKYLEWCRETFVTPDFEMVDTGY